MVRSAAGVAIAVCLVAVLGLVGCREKVKEPSVAGSFYPAGPDQLRSTVDEYVSRAAVANVEGRLLAVIAPHAGYQYSGQIAGYTYRQLESRDVSTVVLIGPSHRAVFRGISVCANGSLKTPLGKVRVNEKMARSLVDEASGVRMLPEAFEKEHSLEVQLPFLQRTLSGFSVVPVLMGAPSRESFDHLASKLVEIMRNDRRVLIVVSTDFSHYHDYETAVRMDMKVIDAIERLAVEEVENLLVKGEGEMCGGYPALLTLVVARELGATDGVLYRYANSGDIVDERKSVVGYAAMGLYQSGLSSDEKRELVRLARDAIVGHVRGRTVKGHQAKGRRLLANGASFVTIKRGGLLRGCIGNIRPLEPLYQSVIRNAISASSRDPRFLPLQEDELGDMDVEVTVLAPLVPLTDTREIKVGTHGLYIMNGSHSGILLPQVALENHWDSDTFLRQVSLKAGMSEGAWKESKVFTFTAEVLN